MLLYKQLLLMTFGTTLVFVRTVGFEDFLTFRKLPKLSELPKLLENGFSVVPVHTSSAFIALQFINLISNRHIHKIRCLSFNYM